MAEPAGWGDRVLKPPAGKSAERGLPARAKEQSDARRDMWRALGQIVPRVESRDTLGSTIATALLEMVGAGQAAVILPIPLPPAGPGGEPRSITYSVRLVGGDISSDSPIRLRGDRGVLARLSSLKETLHISVPWPAEYAAADDPLLQLAQERLVIAPFPCPGTDAEEASPGALCLLDVPRARIPPPDDLAGLATFASVALNLLDSKAQAARQAVEASIITEIGRSLTSSLSLDDIFEQILSRVRSAVDAGAVSVGLIDEETREVILEKALMGPRFTSMPPVRLKLGQGVGGWVAKTGRAVNLPDAYADPRFHQDVDAASGFVTRSILCVPLVVEGKVIGILEAMNKRSGAFTDADERLLSALGAFVVIAIEKASLHSDVLADKRRMDAIFANMTEGLLTVTLGGRITAANLALQTMVGVEDRSLAGRCCCEAIRTDPDILGSLLAQMRTVEKQQDSFHGSCDIIRPDRRRVPVLVSGAATLDDDGGTSEIVVVFSDIGQIRELERMKDDFVANITHEVRTPLATILLYARLLRAGRAKDDPEREARYLDIVAQQSNQIQKLVRKILDLSRMEAMLAYPGRESIQLHALLNEMLVSYQKLAQQKQLVIRADLPADLPAVTASREALQLVFGNLLDNAIKFTSRGEIRLSARQSGKQVQVEVADEGIGIAPESIPHLFERFYRTKEAVERGIGGTGLGLALVKETIEGLGGSVTVTSRPDEGTTFRVVLPIATNSVRQASNEERPPS